MDIPYKAVDEQSSLTLAPDELHLATSIKDAINDMTVYEFLDITFYNDSNAILIRLNKVEPDGSP